MNSTHTTLALFCFFGYERRNIDYEIEPMPPTRHTHCTGRARATVWWRRDEKEDRKERLPANIRCLINLIFDVINVVDKL